MSDEPDESSDDGMETSPEVPSWAVAVWFILTAVVVAVFLAVMIPLLVAKGFA